MYTTQVNSTFRARWLVSSEVISQVLFTSEQPKKNKMAFVGILSQTKLLFSPLVIQLVWYILKQLFTSVKVKVVNLEIKKAFCVVVCSLLYKTNRFYTLGYRLVCHFFLHFDFICNLLLNRRTATRNLSVKYIIYIYHFSVLSALL